jgi:hypothetical protein
MKIAQTLIALSILSALCAESAEARYIVRRHVWYDAEAVAKQQRANMAERTHQLKELQESARLSKQGETISARSTTKEYPIQQGQKARQRLGKMKLARKSSNRL